MLETFAANYPINNPLGDALLFIVLLLFGGIVNHIALILIQKYANIPTAEYKRDVWRFIKHFIYGILIGLASIYTIPTLQASYTFYTIGGFAFAAIVMFEMIMPHITS